MTRNSTAASNEKIIAALLQNGTIGAAAEAAGTSPRTVYDRMHDREFCAQYSEAKNDLLRMAVFNIGAQLAEAIKTISEIMTDSENSAAVRLQAAKTILDNAGKFSDRLSKDERQSRGISNNDPFDPF